MSVEALCKRVTHFGFILLETEFALDAQQHKIESLSAARKSLTWVRDASASLIVSNPARVSDYLSIVERRDYSYLMYDGGIIQVAFIYNRGEIERHRLSYHPCPFPIDRDELRRFDGGLLDLINETLMIDLDQNVLLRSPVRFDYAPDAAADYHPASHITINDPCCRIPARSPLEFATFIKFVLENFYLDAWTHPAIKQALSFTEEAECLSVHDKTRAYLNWAYG